MVFYAGSINNFLYKIKLTAEVKILANCKELLVSGETFKKLMQNGGSGRIRNGKLKILGIKNTPISSNSEK